MDIADIVLQGLPLIASGVTALIVFVKKGVHTDIDVEQLKNNVKEIDKNMSVMLLDIAVLKERTK